MGGLELNTRDKLDYLMNPHSQQYLAKFKLHLETSTYPTSEFIFHQHCQLVHATMAVGK